MPGPAAVSAFEASRHKVTLGTPAKIQEAGGAANATTATATFGATPTAGNALIVLVGNGLGTDVVTTSLVCGTVTFTLLGHYFDSTTGGLGEVWSAFNITGAATTVTVTVPTSSYPVIKATEWSNLGTTPSTSFVSASHNTAATSHPMASGIVGGSPVLFIGGIVPVNDDHASAVSGGTALANAGTAGVNQTLDSAYALSPAVGATLTWTVTSETSLTFGVVIGTSSGGGGGGGGGGGTPGPGTGVQFGFTLMDQEDPLMASSLLGAWLTGVWVMLQYWFYGSGDQGNDDAQIAHLIARAQQAKAAGCTPVICVGEVPYFDSTNPSGGYSHELQWDATKLAAFSTKFATALAAAGGATLTPWVIFGQEGKPNNYFASYPSDIAAYCTNFATFAAAVRGNGGNAGVKIGGPYTTGGIPQSLQQQVWLYAMQHATIDFLVWDAGSVDWDVSLWKTNSDWLVANDPTGTMRIVISEWYPGANLGGNSGSATLTQLQNSAQYAYQMCTVATLPRYQAALMWSPSGQGPSGAVVLHNPYDGTTPAGAAYPCFTPLSQVAVFCAAGSVTKTADDGNITTWTNSNLDTVTVNRSADTVVYTAYGSGGPGSSGPASGIAIPAPPGGWTRAFVDDFDTPVTAGNFPGNTPALVGGKSWSSYDGGPDTAGVGQWNKNTITIGQHQASCLELNLTISGGVPQCASPCPNVSHTHMRRTVCFKIPSPLHNWAAAWLLWPDSNVWSDGEIDWPEGNLDSTIQGYIHDTQGHPQNNVVAYDSGTSWYGTWHTATTEWTSTAVKFYLDNTLVKTLAGPANGVPTVSMHPTFQTETAYGATPTAGGLVLIDWVVVDTA